MAAAVKPVADDQMVAGRSLRNHGQRQGSHPAGGDDGSLGGVELAAFVGQQIGIGMPVAAIGIARAARRPARPKPGRGFRSDKRSTTGSAAPGGSVGGPAEIFGRGQRSSIRFVMLIFRSGSGSALERNRPQYNGSRLGFRAETRMPEARPAVRDACRPVGYVGLHGVSSDRTRPRPLPASHAGAGTFFGRDLVVGEMIGSGIFLKPGARSTKRSAATSV